MTESDIAGGGPDDRVRIAVLRRVIMPYRLGLLGRLAELPGVDLEVFHGEDVPDSKVVNAEKIQDFAHTMLPTRFFRAGKLRLAWHRGLYAELERFRPDAILCEAESNLLSYWVAMRYRHRNPDTALILWSLVWLIGKGMWTDPLAYLYKRVVHGRFDGFAAFSSYSKQAWQQLGIPGDRIVVAPNVADTTKHLNIVDHSYVTREQATTRLGLRGGFNVLYSGTLNKVKKPDAILEIARELRDEDFNFILLGKGPLLDPLRAECRSSGLDRVVLPGHVDPGEVPLYCFASDVLAVPGRGGMVISEAMAYGLPVLVHQADGTEMDLVGDGQTGYRLANGSVSEFVGLIRQLASDLDLRERMGAEARLRARSVFTTQNTAERLLEAVEKGRARRAIRSV